MSATPEREAYVCPQCLKRAGRLLDISRDAWVHWFHCDSCHHTWNVPKTPLERGLPQDEVKRVGHVTYEQRFVIIQVPAAGRVSDPLPKPSPEDVWFDKLATFEAALGGPWDHRPINRQPLGEEPPARPEAKGPRR
jgi:hypothetical protein